MSKENFSGILIFSSFIFTIYSYFFEKNLLLLAGILAWIALGILFFTLKNKKLPIILMILSLFLFLISYSEGFRIDYFKVFTVNQYLLVLLIGVGFLRLVASPKQSKIKNLPEGKHSFIKTYLGVHLFGSVINLSSLILVADKMYKNANLSRMQVIVLTRAFASDAYWSPFFVAFAAALTYAPKLDTKTILFNGLFLAVFAFIFTYIEITNKNKFDVNKFIGYPIAFETLLLPLSLAFLVLLTNHFYPQVKIIVLIALFSFILAFAILPLKKGIEISKEEFKNHILEELPRMKGELSLFLIAGMFGIMVSSILIGLNIKLPFNEFDWIVASILLAIFIVLGFIGIHPIISIAIVGDLLSSYNNTLLAVTFLMAWSTTVSTSPFSGLNLTIVARYDFDAKEIFKANIFFALKMYILSVFCLFVLSNYIIM